MVHRRMRSMKYERKGRKTRSGKLFRKREERMDIDKSSADRQRRRALRDKKEWLDLLEAEDMDEVTQFPA